MECSLIFYSGHFCFNSFTSDYTLSINLCGFFFQGEGQAVAVAEDVQIIVVPDDGSGVLQAQETTYEVSPEDDVSRRDASVLQDLNAVALGGGNQDQAAVNRSDKTSRFFQTLLFEVKNLLGISALYLIFFKNMQCGCCFFY